MEILKTTSNLEFDVIYADGSRRHVAEGVLHEANEGKIIFHNGASRPEVIVASAEDTLKYLKLIGPGLKALAIGMCMSEDARDALRELVSCALQILDPERPVKQAIYRLGQMDMQASACAMLRKMADAAAPSLSTGLNIAADLVEELEVMNADA